MKALIIAAILAIAATAPPSSKNEGSRTHINPLAFQDSEPQIVDGTDKKFTFRFVQMKTYDEAAAEANCTLAAFEAEGKSVSSESKLITNLWNKTPNQEWPHWVKNVSLKGVQKEDASYCVSLYRNRLQYKLCNFKLPYICESP